MKKTKPIVFDEAMLMEIEEHMSENRIFSFGEMARKLIRKGLDSAKGEK